MSNKFEIIVGPMFSGKTEELLRRLKRAKIAGKKIIVFKHEVDERYGDNIVKSRDQSETMAISIRNPYEVFDYIYDEDVICFDELQFFDLEIVNVVYKLMIDGYKVIGTGLDLDYKGRPFGAVPYLCCLADRIDKLTAVCIKCGCDEGTRTFRKIISDDKIVVGDSDKYETRCLDCYLKSND